MDAVTKASRRYLEDGGSAAAVSTEVTRVVADWRILQTFRNKSPEPQPLDLLQLARGFALFGLGKMVASAVFKSKCSGFHAWSRVTFRRSSQISSMFGLDLRVIRAFRRIRARAFSQRKLQLSLQAACMFQVKRAVMHRTRGFVSWHNTVRARRQRGCAVLAAMRVVCAGRVLVLKEWVLAGWRGAVRVKHALWQLETANREELEMQIEESCGRYNQLYMRMSERRRAVSCMQAGFRQWECGLLLGKMRDASEHRKQDTQAKAARMTARLLCGLDQWITWTCFTHWSHRGVTSTLVRTLEQAKDAEICMVEEEVFALQRSLELRCAPPPVPTASPLKQPDWVYQKVLDQLNSEAAQRRALEVQCAGLMKQVEETKHQLGFCHERFGSAHCGPVSHLDEIGMS
eukprot:TRINITY_DN33722_c0_g1_i2.p1 TRINITY_DN33722_c0_g1~~TRINITY_DN33722_c0_g1_i2.p1  ORF type:complete len:402 (-),score=78.71 TRINITY_DN33722_c0_g1_i2:92-1297(-)